MAKLPLTIIILAAGKGTRMHSDLPKVMHRIAHKPLITHVIDAARALNPEKIICVVGPDMPELEQEVAPVKCVVQKERLGTGHAVKIAIEEEDIKGDVMVLYGDVPLITPAMLQAFYDRHASPDKPGVTIMSFTPPSPTGYGRLVLNEDEKVVTRIVEEKDASAEEKKITLCNSGLVCIDGAKIKEWCAQLDNNNKQNEYYIVDIPAIAAKEGRISVSIEGDYESLLGINSRDQLALVETIFQNRKRAEMLVNGVTLQDPATVYFAADTEIEADVTIEPHVVFGPDVTIEKGTTIKAFSHIEGAYICANSAIGPFARLRPGTNISHDVQIGNFVEVSRSSIGAGSKAKHHGYISDAVLGKDVNMGCGSITVNYDGIEKHKTIVKDNVMVGCNVNLIAPVTVEENAYIAAGSSVTENVEKDALYVARARGMVREGWATGKKK